MTACHTLRRAAAIPRRSCSIQIRPTSRQTVQLLLLVVVSSSPSPSQSLCHLCRPGDCCFSRPFSRPCRQIVVVDVVTVVVVAVMSSWSVFLVLIPSSYRRHLIVVSSSCHLVVVVVPLSCHRNLVAVSWSCRHEFSSLIMANVVCKCL